MDQVEKYFILAEKIGQDGWSSAPVFGQSGIGDKFVARAVFGCVCYNKNISSSG